jgi:hypothetical protein
MFVHNKYEMATNTEICEYLWSNYTQMHPTHSHCTHQQSQIVKGITSLIVPLTRQYWWDTYILKHVLTVSLCHLKKICLWLCPFSLFVGNHWCWVQWSDKPSPIGRGINKFCLRHLETYTDVACEEIQFVCFSMSDVFCSAGCLQNPHPWRHVVKKNMPNNNYTHRNTINLNLY